MSSRIKHIEVIPYSLDWPKLFEAESAKIKQALGNNCIAIHHVGSTSVPGLAAKPKIDILAIVSNPTQAIQSLEAIGMAYKGEYNIPMHYGFSKRGIVDVNLHVYEEDHPEIELNLLFRDYLRKNAAARDAYACLKETLLKDKLSFEKHHSLFTGYNLGKDKFIRTALKEAGFNRIRFTKCTHYAEWDAAKYYRQTYFFDKVSISDPYAWRFDHPDHVHFVLYEGVEIIGYAHIQLWPASRAAMRIIVIDPNKRNKGLGKQFLLLIEKWLKNQNYKSIHTESSPAALLFYKKNGYIDTPFNDPDGYESDLADIIRLGKLL